MRPVVLGLLLFFALILGQSPRANADTTPPELVSFSISPLIVDVSGGPATLSVRIEASDDLSGFGSGSTGNGSIDIRHTSGDPPFGRGSLPITGGTLLNPIFEFTLTVPQFSRQGMYPISITLLDNVFNTARFDSSDLATLGFPSQIEVTSIGDTTPPELLNLSVTPLLVDTSTGQATLSVMIEAHDNLSGFGSGSTGNGSIDIRHSSGGNPFGRGSLPITGGTLLNPIFEFTLMAHQFSPEGIYPISVTLLDNVFNQAHFSSSDLAALGFPSQVEIQTPPPVCGDQLLEGGEECDDGNSEDGDGCSALCLFEPPVSTPRLRCQRIIGRAGKHFLRDILTARQDCLIRQFERKLPLDSIDCRDTPTGYERTDKQLARAESQLRSNLYAACQDIAMEGLGFPGQCPDSDGPPFHIENLHTCLRDINNETAAELVETEFPLP